MKYQKADPVLRKLLYARDTIAAGGKTPSVGFVRKSVTEPVERRMLVKLRGHQPPSGFEHRHWTPLGRGIWSVKVTLEEARELLLKDEVTYVEQAKSLGLEGLCSTGEAIHLPEPAGTYDSERLTGENVIIGIIDDGVDFRHPDFLTPAKKTRIAFLWDQEGTPNGPLGPPAGYDGGVEYSDKEINDALHGKLDIPLRNAGHGTHVAAIAAGNGDKGGHQGCSEPHRGVAPQADLIVVRLNLDVDASTLTDHVALVEAVKYIFGKAYALDRPCVVNISLGQNLGSHDGESLVEQLIDHYLETDEGRAVVIAAGNQTRNQVHAQGRLRAGESAVIRLNVPALHAASLWTDVEIWRSSVDRVAVRVRCPHEGHDWTDAVQPDTVLEGDATPCGLGVTIQNQQFTPLNGDSLIYLSIFPGAPGGEWQVDLIGHEIADGEWHAWIERAGIYQPTFPGTWNPQTTLTTPATARRAISVANYNHRDVPVVDGDSGRGPTRDGRSKPELAAPGVVIWAAQSGGSGTDARISKSGTSMSAPHVTGVIALMFEKNRSLTGRQVQAILKASSIPPAGAKGFDDAWGFGRLDAKRALELTPEKE